MLTCKLASTDSDFNAVYNLRYKIYCIEKKWLSTDDYPFMLEKDLYDTSSVHIMGIKDGNLVGALRLIHSCPLPVEQHPSIHSNLITCDSAEISRLVFLKKHRKLSNSLALYRAAYHFSKKQNIKRWFIVAETTFIRAMRVMGFRFSPLGKPTNYFGGTTIPASIDLEETQKSLKNYNPLLYSWFHMKEGKSQELSLGKSYMDRHQGSIFSYACA